MNLDEVKRKIQQHFESGLVVIVGSGLSLAEGIPGMGALEKHLNEEIPKSVSHLSSGAVGAWEKISDQLAKKAGLETALKEGNPPEDLERKILELTYAVISKAEKEVLDRVVSGQRKLPFSRLLPHLNPDPNRALPVITTNYDRLIEVATESIGWGVDTLFIGNHLGLLDPELSQKSFLKKLNFKTRKVQYRERIILTKPHGSLDWYEHMGRPIRSSVSLNLTPLIVTPGRTKYHKGYSPPFDTHREKANSAIDSASRFLILGYGFNDDHLETHLIQELRRGKPALVITHGLTDNARNIMNNSAGLFSLTANPKQEDSGFIFSTSKSNQLFDGPPLWELDCLISEVLGG